MSSRNTFAFILMACLLALGFGSLAPVANAASAGQSILNPSKNAGNNVTKIEYRDRGSQVIIPIGPSYGAYDHAYYSSRGYYPTHMGPGYIHLSYFRKSEDYRRNGGRCSNWHRKCAANWGYRSENYYGCIDYHRCQ